MTNAQERKAQERQARRRRIQEAARTVFTERGYAGASIELIARAAQLSVGAIYLYFRSKEDLYVSLVEDTLTVFDVEMVQVRGACIADGIHAGVYRQVNAREIADLAWSVLLGSLDAAEMGTNLGLASEPIIARTDRALGLIESALAPQVAATLRAVA
jgi:AcrR family transcriptional regulator